MRKACIAAILVAAHLLSSCASVQPVTPADREFERVIEAPGYSRDQIYNYSKIWIAENFKSAKAVIELDSKEDGIIIGNGIIPYPCGGMDCLVKGNWQVPFTMRIDIKDEKFKIRFSNVNLSWPATYNSGVVSPAHNGPVNAQSDMNLIKPTLLAYGDQILATFTSKSNSSEW